MYRKKKHYKIHARKRNNILTQQQICQQHFDKNNTVCEQTNKHTL